MAAETLGVRTAQVPDRMTEQGFRPAMVFGAGIGVAWHRCDVDWTAELTG